jgi:polyhydroxyalkanoate synthase subunit PhaE
MNEKNAYPFEIASGLNTWMQSMGNFWGAMAKPLDTVKPKPNSPQTGKHTGQKPQDAFAAALKNCQSMVLAMSTPESMMASLKGSGAMPEMMLKLSQTSMDSVMEWHQGILQQFSRLGTSVEAYQFQDIHENPCRLWTDTYEKEFHQFFQVPQLGLMRQYQERANQAADKYHLFQSKLSEFQNLLSMPFTRAAQVMQEKLKGMMENGELPDDPKDYYNMWIKVLEGHFMTLMQTSEYAETLAGTLNSLADFSAARDAVIEDVLSLFPVAKKTEMDDMARELYELKKRVKNLEKTQRQTVDR